MRRKIKEIVSPHAFSYVTYIPRIWRSVKNWIPFVFDYVGLTNKGRVYALRNGMNIRTGDGMSSGTIAVIFIKKDYGEPPPPNAVLIDIGANIGVYALYACQSPGVRVYAYEPMPENFSLLKENIARNGLEDRISPYPYAVSGRREKRRLYLGESPLHSFLPIHESPFHAQFSPGKISAQKFIEVECIPLDEVFESNGILRCDLLKIDCEGAEYDILYHLPDPYFSRIREIRLEYHNHLGDTKNTGSALVKFLGTKGFQVRRIKEGSPYQGDVWLERSSTT
ncbi:MAG: FkbM family methyltransferase [Patescibacteria group bacterium]